MSKYESCQSVIIKLVCSFICRLDSSVNYIIKDIPGYQLLIYGAHPRYVNTDADCYVDKTDTQCIQLHVMLGDKLWTTYCHMLYLCALLSLEYCNYRPYTSGKFLNFIKKTKNKLFQTYEKTPSTGEINARRKSGRPKKQRPKIYW